MIEVGIFFVECCIITKDMLKYFQKSLKRHAGRKMKSFKKVFTISAILTGLFVQVMASELCPYAVRVAINKYKSQDYVGCVQDLDEYIEEDPSNSIAFYYSGIAYMKLGMKDKAVESFEKVASINSVPMLSSYAIQATNCMNSNISPCKYKKYSKDEIEEMLVDPGAFFAKKDQETENKAEEVVSIDSEIDKLIHGAYPDNVHPEANKVIQETKLIQEQDRVNAELNKKTRTTKQKSDASSEMKNLTKLSKATPSDKEIADAVRTLSKAGYTFAAPEVANSVGTVASSEKAPAENNAKDSKNTNDNNNFNPYKQMADYYAMNGDAAQMAMMFGGNNYNRNNSFDMMMPYLIMQQQQQKNADGTQSQNKVDPELIKTMMMSQMMNSFDFGFDNNDRRR